MKEITLKKSTHFISVIFNDVGVKRVCKNYLISYIVP